MKVAIFGLLLCFLYRTLEVESTCSAGCNSVLGDCACECASCAPGCEYASSPVDCAPMAACCVLSSGTTGTVDSPTTSPVPHPTQSPTVPPTASPTTSPVPRPTQSPTLRASPTSSPSTSPTGILECGNLVRGYRQDCNLGNFFCCSYVNRITIPVYYAEVQEHSNIFSVNLTKGVQHVLSAACINQTAEFTFVAESATNISSNHYIEDLNCDDGFYPNTGTVIEGNSWTIRTGCSPSWPSYNFTVEATDRELYVIGLFNVWQLCSDRETVFLTSDAVAQAALLWNPIVVISACMAIWASIL